MTSTGNSVGERYVGEQITVTDARGVSGPGMIATVDPRGGFSVTPLFDYWLSDELAARRAGSGDWHFFSHETADFGLTLVFAPYSVVTPTTALEGLHPCQSCGPGVRTGLPGNACENCMGTGEDPETSAWAWVQSLYPNDAASDLAFGADEMVDAYIAGATARRQTALADDTQVGTGGEAERAPNPQTEAMTTSPSVEQKAADVAATETAVLAGLIAFANAVEGQSRSRRMTLACEHTKALVAALSPPAAALAPRVEGWQDIATLTDEMKDGVNRFLVSYTDGVVRVCRWLDNSHTEWPWKGISPTEQIPMRCDAKATHWQPIKSPTPADTDEGA